MPTDPKLEALTNGVCAWMGDRVVTVSQALEDGAARGVQEWLDGNSDRIVEAAAVKAAEPPSPAEEMPAGGTWFEFRGGRLHPVDEPAWALIDDWQEALRSRRYTPICSEVGDIGEGILALDIYHREDPEAGHVWCFHFAASSCCFGVEVVGFAAYLEFLRWLGPALQVAALDKLHYRVEEGIKALK